MLRQGIAEELEACISGHREMQLQIPNSRGIWSHFGNSCSLYFAKITRKSHCAVPLP